MLNHKTKYRIYSYSKKYPLDLLREQCPAILNGGKEFSLSLTRLGSSRNALIEPSASCSTNEILMLFSNQEWDKDNYKECQF